MIRISGRTVAAAVLVSVVLATGAGCAGDSSRPPAPAALSPATGPSSVVPVDAGLDALSTTPPGPSVSAHPPWPSGPITVVHTPKVPPVPVVTRVRYAAHPAEGYDRITFDIPGSLPGYTVRYVTQVRTDPGDQPVRMPGRKFLLVVFHPAQAHRTDGTVTVSGTHRLDLPMLKAYAVVGDYEGYVSIALGLDAKVGYRVGELSDRVYLDVSTT